MVSYTKISRTTGNGPPLSQDDQFGRAAAVLGDVDGDGIVDLAVGALGDDDGERDLGANFGAVWILFLNADGSVRERAKISNTTTGFTGELDEGDEFGRVVGALGDFDGDGVPDVGVGAVYDGDGGSDRGALYLLYLNADGSLKGYSKISDTRGGFDAGLDNGDQFGRAILALGDLDGDGVTELAVGAARDDDGGSRRGAAYILFMNADGTVASHQKISDTKGGFSEALTDSGEFGFDFANLGDLDGDGVVDIAIAAPDQKTDGNQIGAVFVLYLNADGTVKSDFRITEGHAGFTGDLDFNDEFGACLTELGDVDGDGHVDIAVGAGKDDDGFAQNPVDRGAVWILFLNGDGTVKAHQKISQREGNFFDPLRDGDRFGTSVTAPGDFNGDGVRDLFVGSRFDDDGGRNTGSMYLLYLNDGSIAAPTADASAAPTSGPAPLAVTFTDLSTGAVTSWAWDFGDGGSSTLQSPVHTYDTPGTYSVALGVTGAAGSDARTFADLVVVQPPLAPVAGFSASPTSGTVPVSVAFTDESSGVVSSWAWDFGDGASSALQNPTHAYAAAGTYTVALTVSGSGGSDVSTRVDYIVASTPDPPVADFAGAPQSGVAPLPVTFTDLSTGGVTSWAWDFGDGATSAAGNPVHVFDSPGTFSVTLTVTGPSGSDATMQADYVTVQMPPPPVAELSGTPTSGAAPLTVLFTDTSIGGVSAWFWDFGDGATSTVQHPSHTYITPGPTTWP